MPTKSTYKYLRKFTDEADPHVPINLCTLCDLIDVAGGEFAADGMDLIDTVEFYKDYLINYPKGLRLMEDESETILINKFVPLQFFIDNVPEQFRSEVMRIVSLGYDAFIETRNGVPYISYQMVVKEPKNIKLHTEDKE